jgi:hypothetical protein
MRNTEYGMFSGYCRKLKQYINHLFLESGEKNIYFWTYPPPTLYQCVETSSIDVV